MSFYHQKSPLAIPVPGGKMIDEHFGIPTSGNKDVSVAHMIAPPGWAEPFQTPEFDEYTLMVAGEKQVELEGEVIVLRAGDSLRVDRGTRVRYSNPYKADAEYWSICSPAFSLDLVHREEE